MDFTYTMTDDWYFFCEMIIKSDLLMDEPVITLEGWLQEEGPGISKMALELINKALNDREFEPTWIDGNVYDCYIEKEYSTISFQFEEAYSPTGDCPQKPCKVPNKLLYEIVETWQKEYEKWKKRRDDFLKKNPNYRPPVIGKLEDFFPKKNKE